jgi:hypothetical protein
MGVFVDKLESIAVDGDDDVVVVVGGDGPNNRLDSKF